ncbi:hypothetical protein N5P37_008789 [Trichoderma harzianum]|uniref:Uncharacterized protein n=1 Tax=Trichoderma harzianum CBS 226.95 TaxID=983964 RepID=A0A2T4A733_TRIHA|nr:hypothetical protein M431DRAFT_557425 [Trichoderma harzianum CBS 226.95]KAK0758391.1 hypothetical protein N5P37_008789 [Trichoderma harzianum]PKK41612.1 hypothetical protein CI102_14448 [Trichoderma harzianum]PTB52861.1 hypothetical protein M431DRAFT_557425 [Trichoderma harzianum CBS 226.95]
MCCSSGTLADPFPPANSDGICKTISAVNGDGCGCLASKRGLASGYFITIHRDPKFFSSLQVGQHVWCGRDIANSTAPAKTIRVAEPMPRKSMNGQGRPSLSVTDDPEPQSPRPSTQTTVDSTGTGLNIAPRPSESLSLCFDAPGQLSYVNWRMEEF